MLRQRHLDGVLAKIIRADEHFKALKLEISDYLAACARTLTLPVKIDPRQNRIRISFKPIQEPNLRISVILGDCLHNTRSTLDCLWKRLGGEDKFPMFCDREGNKNWRSQRAKRLKGIRADAHAIIDELQPCCAGENAPAHPLAILNNLANTDKHDTIHFTKPLSANTLFVFSDKETGQTFTIKPPLIFHYDTDVVIENVPNGRVHPGMNVQIKGNLFVSFKDDGPWSDKPVEEVIGCCLDFVKTSVVEPLIPFTT